MAPSKETLKQAAEKAGIGTIKPREDVPASNEYEKSADEKGISDPTNVSERKSGDIIYHWGDPLGWDIMIGVRGLRRDKEELWGLIEVQFRRSPSHPVRRLLSEQRINFRSGSSKTNAYRALERREKNFLWEERIEWIAGHIQDQLRAKITPVSMGTVTESGPAEFLIWPYLETGEVCTIYGDGGSTKSLFTQLLALSLTHGMEHVPGTKVSRACKVLIVDYETNPATVRRRLRLLADGHGIPREIVDQVLYLPVADPIYEVSAEIGRYIRENEVDLAIVDSASAATQGGVSDESETMRYFNSIRTWGTTVLTIAHLPKESRGRGPAGVKQWENQSRNTYEVVIDDDDGTGVAHVAVIHQKTNNDRKQRPMGFRVDFTGGKIRYEEEAAKATLDSRKDDSLKTPDRIRMLLEEQGTMSAREVAEELNVSESAVSNILRRWLQNGDAVKTNEVPALWSLKGHQAKMPERRPMSGDEQEAVEELDF